MNNQPRTQDELKGVTLLGNQNTKYFDTYNPSVLETFVNKHPDNDYVVTFDGYEGTSLCPKTGQPDFFKVMDPKYLEVRGIFSPRGGISIYPFFNYAGDKSYESLECQRKIDIMRDSCSRTVRYDR